MCPTIEQLESLLATAHPLAEQQRLRDHLGGCADCRSSLAELRENLREAARLRDVTFRETAGIAADPPDPQEIPGYRALVEISRGGQGVVFRAVQESTGQAVAIKMLREGAHALARDRSRFEREVQILGQLNHPSIVSIHDSGACGGRPYFVMDYVEGPPLHEFVRPRRSRSTAGWLHETLRLFADICDAVHVAHLNGVIHRDLKPSNIRIGPGDRPRILDFGLAKLSRQEDDLSMTASGQFLGSLPWSSPEQADGAARIDARTDVYSLGVLLFHLLTGAFPYDVTGSLRSVLERIIHAPPRRPSALAQRSNRELDAIILKCLEKEPARRYQSASEISADLRRLLSGQPVHARGASPLYQLRKLAGRHRVTTALAVTIMLLVTASTAVLGWLALALRSERDLARSLQTQTKTASEVSEQVASFLGNLFTGANPSEAGAESITLRSILDAGAARLETELSESPLVRARLSGIMAKVYAHLNDFAAARRLAQTAVDLRRAHLAPDDPQTAESLQQLGDVLGRAGQMREAVQAQEQALELLKARFGDDDPVAEAWNELASTSFYVPDLENALRCFREGLRIYRLRHDDDFDGIATTQRNIGMTLVQLGRLKEAREVLTAALERDRRRRDSVGEEVTLNHMAHLAFASGSPREAQRLLEEEIGVARRIYHDRHPRLVWLLQQLAFLCRANGDDSASVPILREALTIQEATWGPVHADVAATLGDLGQALVEIGDRDEGVQALRRSLRIRTELFGADLRAISLHNLAAALEESCCLVEAADWQAQAIERLAADDPNGPTLINPLTLLAGIQGLSGAADLAAQTARRALRIAEEKDAQQSAIPLNQLGVLAMRKGDLTAADRYFERACEAAKNAAYPSPQTWAAFRANRGAALRELGELERADAWLERAVEAARRQLDPFNTSLLGVLVQSALVKIELGQREDAANLLRDVQTLAALRNQWSYQALAYLGRGRLLRLSGEEARAEPALRSALACFQRDCAPIDWCVASARAELGLCLAATGRTAEARQELEAALQVFQSTLGPDHPRTHAARRGLALLNREAREGRSGARHARVTPR